MTENYGHLISIYVNMSNVSSYLVLASKKNKKSMRLERIGFYQDIRII